MKDQAESLNPDQVANAVGSQLSAIWALSDNVILQLSDAILDQVSSQVKAENPALYADWLAHSAIPAIIKPADCAPLFNQLHDIVAQINGFIRHASLPFNAYKYFISQLPNLNTALLYFQMLSLQALELHQKNPNNGTLSMCIMLLRYPYDDYNDCLASAFLKAMDQEKICCKNHKIIVDEAPPNSDILTPLTNYQQALIKTCILERIWQLINDFKNEPAPSLNKSQKRRRDDADDDNPTTKRLSLQPQ